jgi:hypothetical protein
MVLLYISVSLYWIGTLRLPAMAGARTTFVQWTPAYWVLPESSCHCENNSHIVLRPKHRNIGERDKRLSTSYLELLIILDLWLF